MNKEAKGFLDKKELTTPQEIFLNKFQLKEPLEQIKSYYTAHQKDIKLTIQDDDDYYPLHQMIYLKNLNYVKFIVENLPNKTSDINCEDSIGNTPLHIAVTLKNTEEIINYLLQQGADINIKNKKNQTPLHLACGKNRVENVNILLSNPKIDYNVVDSQGFTPLIKACASQSYDVVKCLLRSNDVKLNVQDLIGNTAMHYLCEDEKYEMAILLIKAGADYNIKNKEEKTPIDKIKTDDIKNIISSFIKNNLEK